MDEGNIKPITYTIIIYRKNYEPASPAVVRGLTWQNVINWINATDPLDGRNPLEKVIIQPEVPH